MSEWQTQTLSSVGVQLIDCDHKTPAAVDKGKPYVGIPQVKDGRIDLACVRHISEEDFEQWTRKAKPQFNDVVLSRRCNPGETAYVPEGLEFALGQNLVLLRSYGDRVRPEFLRWLVRGPAWWEQVQTFINVGAVFDSLKCREIPEFELPIPPDGEQQLIAGILTSLDEKIELNRKQNRTLEAIAQALFKRWFVEFEFPDENGQPYKSSGGAMQPSELEEIPVEWEVKQLADVVDINGWTLGAKDELDQIDYIEISEVMRGEVKKVSSYVRGEEPSRARRRLRHGDSVISTVRPDRGAYFLALKPSNQLIASTGFAVLSARAIPWSFLHSFITQPSVSFELGRLAEGGAYPAVRADVIGGFPLVTPAAGDLLERFHSVCAHLYEKADMSRKANKNLARLRDTLLPKLMSAELRVETKPGIAT